MQDPVIHKKVNNYVYGNNQEEIYLGRCAYCTDLLEVFVTVWETNAFVQFCGKECAINAYEKQEGRFYNYTLSRVS